MLEELKEANNYIINQIEEKDILLLEMEEYAKENRVPIVTKDVAEYLKFMAKMNKSKDILEIGTAIGYSGTILGRVAKENSGKLTTIEINEEMYDLAKGNFKKAKLDNINLIFGDGKEEIGKLEDEYDFIFIDAAKGQYKSFFDKSYELLKKDGIIFIDNILFRGFVYKEETPKRYKTMIKRLREFISYLYKSDFDFVLQPFGDGIGLVRK